MLTCTVSPSINFFSLTPVIYAHEPVEQVQRADMCELNNDDRKQFFDPCIDRCYHASWPVTGKSGKLQLRESARQPFF